MKTILRLTILVLLLGSTGCKRHKIIPDDELALIFHDAFLTNAYLHTRTVGTDSLNLYAPIFARYGYTTEDVQYTIGNFSKRKSARLGDVVERAIDLLETEGRRYDREVAILDTIDNVARRTARRPLLSDSLVRIERLSDTARLHFVFDVEPGDYTLRFDYEVDSLDRNVEGLRLAAWFERDSNRRANVYNSALRRYREERFSRTYTADSTHRRLHLVLMTFAGRPARPSMTLTNLRLDYTPPTRRAVEELYERQLDLRIFADDFLRAALEKDSL